MWLEVIRITDYIQCFELVILSHILQSYFLSMKYELLSAKDSYLYSKCTLSSILFELHEFDIISRILFT